MNMRFLPSRRFYTGPSARRVLLAVLLVGTAALCRAQSLPKTVDVNEDIAADGSVDMGFQFTFDAAPWRQWKAMVGDEPARLRAMMRHQFAAVTMENFKLDRDDMNRTAKISIHSPTGPELRDDGSYQIPMEEYFRLVNGSGRSWYFSGNNPNAGGSLNNVKVTLPANAQNAYVANPGTPDQALVFALTPPASPSRWLYLAGAVVTLLGLGVLAAALALGRQSRVMILPPAAPRALPASGMSVAVPPPLPTAPQQGAYVPPKTPGTTGPDAGQPAVCPPPTGYNEPD